MPLRPTHRFTATFKGQLAGVVVMATPNSFSNLLGPDSRHQEKLISRGACISWSPKNLGSALVIFSVRCMAKHTAFRIFTAYSDTEARELGTIYQACNFIYLGQTSNFLRSGGSFRQLSKILGHRNRSDTERIYKRFLDPSETGRSAAVTGTQTNSLLDNEF